MKKTLIWIIAVAIMISAVIYQRTTGPTYPFRGSFESNGETFKYKLIRSEETLRNATVILPNPGQDFAAQLHYKRYKTSDSIRVDKFRLSEGEWKAELPIQPAAGKMEYFVTLQTDGQNIRIPAEGEENIVLRYKDFVPRYILWPHIFMMFFAVLIGMRAGLSALFEPQSMRIWAFISLGGMTLGGMILGPIVQKYAFGEYWTGFPFGGDLTDNKMLIMWVSWLIAAAVIGTKAKKKELVGRIVVVFAAIVMTTVYMIPHSMRGSELNYEAVDQGIDPAKAIKTGE